MQRVTMMDSFTHCCKKTCDPGMGAAHTRRKWMLMAGACIASAGLQAVAEAPPMAQSDKVSLEIDGDAVLLNSLMPWSLPRVVEDALYQGIPVHFVAEVNVVRTRWYWSNQNLLSARKYFRLSYQPLTRRWRVYVGNVAFTGQGLGLALASTYESLEDALKSMQRLSRWRIGDASMLPTSGPAQVDLRFRIDLSHLPRPLQIGAFGRSDWNLLVTQDAVLNFSDLQ